MIAISIFHFSGTFNKIVCLVLLGNAYYLLPAAVFIK